MRLKSLTAYIFLLLLLCSCGVQKRLYTNGYYMQKRSSSVKPQPLTLVYLKPDVNKNRQNELLLARADNSGKEIEALEVKGHKNFCDTIILKKDKKRIICTVVMAEKGSVMVKSCSGIGGITEYAANEVDSIIYDKTTKDKPLYVAAPDAQERKTSSHDRARFNWAAILAFLCLIIGLTGMLVAGSISGLFLLLIAVILSIIGLKSDLWGLALVTLVICLVTGLIIGIYVATFSF